MPKQINTYLILIISILITNCGQSKKHPDATKDTIYKTATAKIKAPDCDSTSWLRADKDSVLVYQDEDHKGYYKKGELKRILKSYPELNDTTFINPPDETYTRRGINGTEKPWDAHLWECEVCRDDYYILYSHFLKQHNGIQKYAKERKQLVSLYRAINSIFGSLKHGGTYFGHQYARIIGYAEYSIYLKKFDTGHEYYYKPYNIAKQKKLYINQLKQIIEDEVSVDNEIAVQDKQMEKNELFKTVSEIDGLITDYFYLKMTQNFQYSHY